MKVRSILSKIKHWPIFKPPNQKQDNARAFMQNLSSRLYTFVRPDRFKGLSSGFLMTVFSRNQGQFNQIMYASAFFLEVF